MRALGALLLFAVAVGVMFVQPGPQLVAVDALAAPFDLRGHAEHLARDGRWVDTYDVLTCAIDHASGDEKEAIRQGMGPVQDRMD